MVKKEVRTICRDEDLSLEAYRFEGIVQPFPNHFHDYYVVGFVESGSRRLSCKNTEYVVGRGDILLFNPYDNHGCIQADGGAFDYRGLNIPSPVMQALFGEITGSCTLFGFSQNVVMDDELRGYLQALHQMLMSGGEKFEKEEALLLLMSMLIEHYGQPFSRCTPECRDEIEDVCSVIEEHYAEHISLDQLCRYSSLSKSTLLRAFAKYKGVTPYRYLQSVRISKAKGLLEDGMNPVETALQTGFTDHSHFTNFFRMYIGLSPAVYRRIFRESQGLAKERNNEHRK